MRPLLIEGMLYDRYHEPSQLDRHTLITSCTCIHGICAGDRPQSSSQHGANDGECNFKLTHTVR